MILATYLPCKKENVKFPIKCFCANTPEELLTNSILFQSDNLEEELILFQTNQYKLENSFIYIDEIPFQTLTVPMGSVIEGDAFVMDNQDSEFMPELQKNRREQCEKYLKKQSFDTYPEYLKIQKEVFEFYLLPLWAPVLIGRITGNIYEIHLNASLSPGDIVKLHNNHLNENEILNLYYAKGLKSNDECWCHSGKKYKKCHGRVC